MSSYFFPSIFLATLNTSTSKSKSVGKTSNKKEEEEKKKKEKKEDGGEGEKVKVEAENRKPAKTLSSQIPKKTSPKKPLMAAVKEEPSMLKKDTKRGNCKYCSLLFTNVIQCHLFCFHPAPCFHRIVCTAPSRFESHMKQLGLPQIPS